jgi:hypothetical protein
MARALAPEELNRVVYSKYFLQRANALATEGHDMALPAANRIWPILGAPRWEICS